jgi:hypothetical protein
MVRWARTSTRRWVAKMTMDGSRFLVVASLTVRSCAGMIRSTFVMRS